MKPFAKLLRSQSPVGLPFSYTKANCPELSTASQRTERSMFSYSFKNTLDLLGCRYHSVAGWRQREIGWEAEHLSRDGMKAAPVD